MDRGHTSPSRRWTSTTTGSSPSTRWKQGLHCFCFPPQTFLTTSKCLKWNDMHVKASCLALARWKSTWRRSLSAMVTLPTTLYTRTWWRISSPKRMRTKTASYPQESLRTNTMNFDSAHAVRQSFFYFMVEILWSFVVQRKHSLRLPESISGLQKHVCVVCDVWTPPVWRFVWYDSTQQGFFNQFISVVFCFSRYLCFLF